MKEQLTAQKIIQNCLDCYDLSRVQDKKLQKELSLNILKDLQDAGFIQSYLDKQDAVEADVAKPLNYTRFYIDGYEIQNNILYAHIITECNLKVEQPLLEELINGNDFIQHYKDHGVYLSDKYSTVEEFEKLVNADSNVDFVMLIAKYFEHVNGTIWCQTVAEIEFPDGIEPEMKPRFLEIGSIVDTAYGIGKVLPHVKMNYWEVEIVEPKRRYKKGIYRISDAKLYKIISHVG